MGMLRSVEHVLGDPAQWTSKGSVDTLDENLGYRLSVTLPIYGQCDWDVVIRDGFNLTAPVCGPGFDPSDKCNILALSLWQFAYAVQGHLGPAILQRMDIDQLCQEIMSYGKPWQTRLKYRWQYWLHEPYPRKWDCDPYKLCRYMIIKDRP